MVRPLNAAKPATTSRMSELSHVTVMRGACDCSPSRACAARYSSIESSGPLAAGVTTRAACPPRLEGGDAGAGALATSGTLAALWLDHAANAVRSVPIFTRTWPARRSIW